jgi:hypothetical protein
MLKELWDFLFYSCRHKWKIIEKLKVYTMYSGELPEYDIYVQECTKCGEIKRRKIC